MRTFAYPARFEPEGEGFVVTFQDFPEAITQGDDRADALAQAADALGTALAGRILDGSDVPEPSAMSVRAGWVRVAPTATIAAKVALYLAMRERHVSAAELARRLGIDHKEARRLVSPREQSKMPRLEEALAAVGQQVEISVRSEHAPPRAVTAPLTAAATHKFRTCQASRRGRAAAGRRSTRRSA